MKKQAAPSAMKVDQVAGLSKNERNNYGLALGEKERGFKIAPEGLMACEDIFDYLFEKMEERLMEKRVDEQFRSHSVQSALVISMNTIYIQSITNDPGDDPRQQMNSTMISGFEPYNYEEECTEPVAAKVDNNGGNRKAQNPKAFNRRLDVEQFNKLYKMGADGPPPEAKSPNSPIRRQTRVGSILRV